MLRVELSHPLRDLRLDVALDVGAGERVALAGASGAGKTTVLRAIAGLLRPQRGRISCGGELWLDTERRVDVRPERRRCGVVFQDYALFGHLSAWRNVAYGLRGMRGHARRAAALELLERFDAAALADARPGELSGGERQRVALARALARDPAALLLDEPLSALDARTARQARHTLGELLHAAAVPAIVVTHDFAEAAMLADRVAVLDGGRIVQYGAPAELAASPSGAFVADFTGASVLEGTAQPGPRGLTVVELAGGGHVVSTDAATGAVSVVVRPWDVVLEPADAAGTHEPAPSSSRNRLPARVVAVTPLGNRLRVGLALPDALVAEVTEPAAEGLALGPGAAVVATWKATATRLVPR